MRGLLNLGNTCYFNTAVQCLAHCPPLTKRLFLNSYDGPCAITKEYQKLCRSLFLAKAKDPLDPSDLLKAFQTKFPRFTDGHQHDSQEVIVCLLDVLEVSLGKEFIQNIFNGEELQETAWKEGKSIQKSIFTTLILEPKGSTSLDALIKARENIHTVDNYKDVEGKEWPWAAIRTKVSKWPKIIGFTFAMYSRKFPISIPNSLETGHRLFALVIHMGSVYGGHYALAVRRYDKWYLKDDDSVTEMPDGPKLTGSYYMAWYRS
jgi:hypothetical protein